MSSASCSFERHRRILVLKQAVLDGGMAKFFFSHNQLLK